MIKIKHGDPWMNLAWRYIRIGKGWSAIIACPGCRRPVSIEEYPIDAKGRVAGKVDCPYMSGCNFSGKLVLLDWNQGGPHHESG